ncbi:MAG: helix-turn-helix transcriptional regulator [Actinomycetota bacterium]
MQVDRGYLDWGHTVVLDVLEAGGALVVGPAGSGLTSLLTAIGGAEAARSRRVLWGRGRRHGAPSGELASIAAAPSELLSTAASAPTTVLVDDAHLLDDATLRALAFVAERRDEVGMRVVVARRPVQPRAELAALDALLVGPHGACYLPALSREALEKWAAAAGGDDPASRARELAKTTGGWPELVVAMLDRDADGADPVRDLISSRLALASGRCRRALCAIAFGFAPGSGALRDAAGIGDEDLDETLSEAFAEGLLHTSTVPEAAVAAALRSAAGAADRARIAAAALTAPAAAMGTVAAHLAALGDCSPEAGELYEAAAGRLESSDPRAALEMLDRALAAGRAEIALRGARARTALAAGDPGLAVALADAEAAATAGVERAFAQAIAGAAWAHLGRPDLAAASLLAAARTNTADHELAALAAVAAAATGSRGPFERSEPTPPPAGAAHDLLEGATAWVLGDAARAESAFGRAAQVTAAIGGAHRWPDSPHALAALVALNRLDPGAANRVLSPSFDRGVGGTAFAARHRLLAAWATLRSGRVDDASSELDTAEARTPRDRLVGAVLAAAVALRAGAPRDLAEVYREVVDSSTNAELDLFSVDLIVEHAHVAARVGADARDVLAPVERACAAAGSPPSLAVPLAWARLLIAGTADDAAAAAEAASALSEHARHSEAARVLGHAASAFASVLAGTVDVDDVRDAASGIAERGLVFEAARLLGAAGLRCTDASVAKQLLGESRRLRGTRRSAPRGRAGTVEALTEREREVARCVLEGLSHREIGEALFISAKTVEHHVARIRQKLGATSRADLLAGIGEELARADAS